MSLKMKLTSAIIMFMLAIATLVIGVLAAQTQSINMEGTINFEISDRSLYVKNVRLEDSDGSEIEIKSFMPGYINDGITLSLGTHTVSNTSFKIHFDLINTTSNTYEAGDVILSSELQTANVVASASGTISPTSETIPEGETYAPITDSTLISGTITLSINSPNTTSIDLSGITVAVDQYIRNYSEEGFEFSGEELIAYTGTASEVIIPSSYSINELGEFVEGTQFQVTAIADGMQVGSASYESVFANNSYITNVFVPNTIQLIGDYTFLLCDNLQLVSFDKNSQLQTIGNDAFYNCSSLTTITIPEEVTSIGSSAFSGCYALAIVYNNSSTLTITAGNSGNGSVGRYAKEVVTASSPLVGKIETIGNVKYYINETTNQKIALAPAVARNALTTVTLASDTTEINQYAFYQCESLQTVVFGTNSSLQTIGSYAFYNCKNLQSVDFGTNSSLQTIGTDAFDGCRSLTTITIPEGVTSIGDSAFYDCYALAIVYNNSNTLTITAGNSGNGYVGYYAKEVVTKSNPQVGKIETIGNVNYYVNETKNQKIALAPAVARDTLTSVTLASDTTEINQYAFYQCESLETVVFGTNSSLQTIGSYAFYNCINLQSVDFGTNSSLQTIGSYAFSYCTSLQTVDFGTNSQLQTIESYAFSGCRSLTTITIPEGVTSIGNYAFQDCYALAIVYNNSNTLTITAGNSGNGYVGYYAKEVVTKASSAQGEIVTENQVQYYVNGSTKIALAPAVARNALTTVTLASDTTEINQYAFYQCESLQTVDFGANSSLQTIGDYAFQWCSSLQTVNFGTNSSLQTIGSYAFSYCTSLQTVVFGTNSSLQTIGSYAFYNCINLQSVDFGTNSSLQTIGERAFRYCSSLTTITIPEKVTSIGSWAFEGCSSLTIITIPKSVNSIGSSAFYRCSKLTTVVIEGQDVYNNATSTSACGYLLQYAKTVKVRTSVVEAGTNNYLTNTSNFPHTWVEGEYTVFSKNPQS